MTRVKDVAAVQILQKAVEPLTGAKGDYDPLMEMIGDARLVLLGEATHGSHEFYRERAKITRRLIAEKNFSAVAMEADWPDAYRINRYIRRSDGGRDAIEALKDFTRFPLWMWRNTEVLEFINDLRDYNDAQSDPRRQVGFYGLDLYSLHASVEAVIRYLDTVDPKAAKRARERYGCFDHFGHDPREYGYAAGLGLSDSCEEEVRRQLVDLRQHAEAYARMDGRIREDALFYAEQNARIAKNAEAYYRSMFHGHVESWNLRDTHMAETLDALSQYLGCQVESPKIVVWAHNSHIGDERATEIGRSGQLNLGQLVRERYGDDSRLVGFTTHTGTVTAASNWGGPAERKREARTGG